MQEANEVRDYFISSDYDYTDYFVRDETLSDVWDNCVVLSLEAIIPTISKFILINFCFGCLLTTGRLSRNSYHILSGCTGLSLVLTLKSLISATVIFTFIFFSYLLIIISFKAKLLLNYKTSNIIKLISVPTLILCEYFLLGPNVWLDIRGEVMILVMKIISISEDLNAPPNILQYFGYVLCGGNAIFGPWISFSEYLSFQINPPKKSVTWVLRIVQTLLYSLTFVTISNCWASYIIPDSYNRWMVAYKEAFSFRTSHYFICFLSEAGMVAAGLFNRESRRYVITEPAEIEFPSSLAMVVRKWNHPINDFLKKHIFRSWLEYGKFPAIFATFLMSALLHGFEIKISAVLISLGIFSYLQVATRDKIADIFNCCVRVRDCRHCNHTYGRSNIFVSLLLIIFSFTTILHLMYLGILMDASTDEIGIFAKWSNLFFISHLMMLFNVVVLIS